MTARSFNAAPIVLSFCLGFPLAAQAAPLRILCAGDSITDGLAATDSYRADLKADLAARGIDVEFVGGRSDEFNPRSTLKHEGIPGLRIEQLAPQLDGWVDQYRPDVVLVMIGTNNIYMDYDVAPAREAVRALAAGVAARHPSVQFVFSNIPPLKRPDWDEHARQYNTIFPEMQRQLERGNLSFVDSYSRLSVADLFEKLNGDEDGIHPNPQGMVKIAAAWAEQIQRLHQRALVGGALAGAGILAPTGF